MIASITELRRALAEATATIDGLRATARLTDKVNPPHAAVWRKPFTYDDVQHGPSELGAVTYVFGVTVYASRTNEAAAQDLLDEYAEPTSERSIKQAIENDDDLAGMCDWAIVSDVDEIQIVTIGAVDYLAETFTVELGVS